MLPDIFFKAPRSEELSRSVSFGTQDWRRYTRRPSFRHRPDRGTTRFVDLVADFQEFNSEQRAEAYHITQADAQAALESFRSVASAIPSKNSQWM